MALQYSDTSNLQGLVQDVAFFCGGNNGTLPSDYSSNDCKRNLNQWYRTAVNVILESVAGWEFKDSVGSANLVAGTRSYQLSAGGGLNIAAISLLKITRVEVSYDGTNYYRATPLDRASVPEAFADGAIDAKSGLVNTTEPFYVLREDYIDIYPAPAVSVTSGLKVYYTADVTDLSSAADYAVMPSIFNRILSMGAALDYCIARSINDKASAYQNKINEMLAELRVMVHTRNKDNRFVAQVASAANYE